MTVPNMWALRKHPVNSMHWHSTDGQRLAALCMFVLLAGEYPCLVRWRRFVVADHVKDDIYVVAADEQNSSSSRSSADSWLDATAAQISALAAAGQPGGIQASQPASGQQHQQKQPNGYAAIATANGAQYCNGTTRDARGCGGAVHAAEVQPRHSRQQYLHNVQACLQVELRLDGSCLG